MLKRRDPLRDADARHAHDELTPGLAYDLTSTRDARRELRRELPRLEHLENLAFTAGDSRLGRLIRRVAGRIETL